MRPDTVRTYLEVVVPPMTLLSSLGLDEETSDDEVTVSALADYLEDNGGDHALIDVLHRLARCGEDEVGSIALEGRSVTDPVFRAVWDSIEDADDH